MKRPANTDAIALEMRSSCNPGLRLLAVEIKKGLNSGPAHPFEWDAFMERKFGATADA